MPAVW
jgi:hypothetical protein